LPRRAQNAQAFWIKHELPLTHAHLYSSSLSNCPAVRSSSTCACWRWNVASNTPPPVALFDRARSYGRADLFFPLKLRLQRSDTLLRNALESRTSFAASISRNRAFSPNIGAYLIFLLSSIALATCNSRPASPTAAFRPAR